MASLSQGRTTAAQCGLFTHKSVPVIFEPPFTNIWQVDTFRRNTVILVPKISNPLAHFICTPSYKPTFIKYIFMLQSSTFSSTHNYFFLFELVFKLVFFNWIFVYVPFSTFPLLNSSSAHIFTNISFRLQLPLFYHMHLILLFSLHIKFFVVSSTAFYCWIFLSYGLSPFRIYFYSETCLKRNMDITETLLSRKLLQFPLSGVLRIQNSRTHM